MDEVLGLILRFFFCKLFFEFFSARQPGLSRHCHQPSDLSTRQTSVSLQRLPNWLKAFQRSIHSRNPWQKRDLSSKKQMNAFYRACFSSPFDSALGQQLNEFILPIKIAEQCLKVPCWQRHGCEAIGPFFQASAVWERRQSKISSLKIKRKIRSFP